MLTPRPPRTHINKLYYVFIKKFIKDFFQNKNKISIKKIFIENPDNEIPCWPEIKLSLLIPYIIPKFYDSSALANTSDVGRFLPKKIRYFYSEKKAYKYF